MKILVLAEDYTVPNERVALHYIHSRNLYYIKKGIEVNVLSFRAKRNYSLEGVNVFTYKSMKEMVNNCKFDLLVSHAPNIRHHLLFLKKYGKCFSNFIFFFHGHEVLKVSDVYPEPYDFMKNKVLKIKSIIQNFYDLIKLHIWKKVFSKTANKNQFVFVSNWMLESFLKYVKINPETIKNNKHIIYNCVGKDFEEKQYDYLVEKEFDFITIRNNLDGSKYGIDIVNNLAKNNPSLNFVVVGKGDFFKHNLKASNLKWVDANLDHYEVMNYLDKSRCALLPTRADAQGVMACEMATYGIPLITSNIKVCYEIFQGFENVELISNSDFDIDLNILLKKMECSYSANKNERFFAENTVDKEFRLIKNIINKAKRPYNNKI